MNIALNDFSDNTLNQQITLAVRNGYKSFSEKDPPILNNFSMTIPTGSVYSLLGSSGCGKTTLISCILKFLKLDQGEIFINIASENSHHDQHDKLDIGYMPQETSLYTHLSIEETLQYFGRLFEVGEISLRDRIAELLELLSLSGEKALVGKLSGGQQKRVSLAAALIHQPRLLILDEPTSGVDPLLRVRIWQYLKHLANNKQVTVLLTTHYTEEARNADIVGVMRDGCLVAEENPNKLMAACSTSSLENVVLSLWKREHNGTANVITPAITNLSDYESPKSTHLSKLKNVQKSMRRIQALVWKNRVTMWRSLALLCFVTVMPAINTLVTYTTFQHDPPQNLPFGVVNNDAACFNTTDEDLDGLCVLEELSCKFLMELNSSGCVRSTLYSSGELATEALKNGDIYGILTFPKNFTDTFTDRIVNLEDLDDAAWNESNIQVQFDQSNKVNYAAIMSTLYSTLEKFLIKLAGECRQTSKHGEYPLQYSSPPLVGRESLGFVDFILPGFSFSWLIYFPLSSASVRIIGEKRQGTMTRVLVSGPNGQGTKLWEFLIAYVITETGVVIFQAVIVNMIIRGVIFAESDADGYDDIGQIILSFFSLSNALVFALFIFGGVSGVSFGCILGLLCTQEIQAGLIAIAVFLPNSYISGIVWPLEGMPLWLQYISPCLPFTMPSESLRSLLSRDWEFTDPGVWPGFLSVGMYNCFYIVLVILLATKGKFNL